MSTDEEVSFQDAIPEAEWLAVSNVAEMAYCPRSAWYEVHAGRRKARNAAVEAGFVEDQARLDREQETRGELVRHRAVDLVSERLGLRGQIDLVEEESGELMPTEYRHGSSPGTACDRVAITLLALMLEEQSGRAVPRARLFFMDDRQSLIVEIDAAARARALELTGEARRALTAASPPANPLQDICKGCSWFGVCSPDLAAAGRDEKVRVLPRRQFERVLYVEKRGSKVRLRDGAVEVHFEDQVLMSVGLETLDQVVLVGDGAHITTPAMRELARRGVDLALLAWNGRFEGRIVGEQYRNPELRRAQHRRSMDPAFRQEFVRAVVRAKIANQRVSLQRLKRRGDDDGETDKALRAMAEISSRAEGRAEIESLRGEEGLAARHYFAGVKAQMGARGIEFLKRERRPPKDPLNAVLSFCYAMLTKDVEAAIQTVGLDPCLGFFHSERYGRPALALDLMEEFRPVIADAVAFKLFSRGMLKEEHFVEGLGTVKLSEEGRKKLYRCWEDRMTEVVAHPLLETSFSLRRTIEVQVRLLVKVLEGDCSDYRPFRWR